MTKMAVMLKNETYKVLEVHKVTSTQIFVLPGNTLGWIFLDAVLFILIFSGNILTILAVRLSRRLRHVLSNYLILNLAVSDLLVGLALPYHLAFYLSETINKVEATCLLRFVMISLACCASVFNVSAIAADRYFAIVHPFEYSMHMTRKVISIIVSIGWAISIAIATIPVYWNNFDAASVCELDIVLPRNYVVVILAPTFFIVWASVLALYVRIWKETNIHVHRLKTNGVDTNRSNDRKSVQVVLLILGCFSICWLPYLMVACTRALDWHKKSTPIYYKATFSLAMANSGMNPIIYAWKNSNFRKAFSKLLHCQTPNHNDFNSSLKNYLRQQNRMSMSRVNYEDDKATQEITLPTICDNRTFNSENAPEIATV